MPAALNRSIKVGTDCSGMETPLMALKRLRVGYEHQFSCDIDKHVKTTIEANCPPKVWYDNLMTRDNDTAPAVDLYLAGFPCQPFSAAGLQKGFKDKRGMVFYGVADFIDTKRPRAFILENVRRLINHNEGKTLHKVMQSLEGIGDGAYSVQWKVLNTLDHGVPQSRPRIYLVGIRKDCQKKEFEFPESLPRVSIEGFLDRATRKPTLADGPQKSNTVACKNVKQVMKILTKEGKNPLKKPFIIDCDSSLAFRGVMEDRVMCMTKSRSLGHWVSSRGRRMNTDEMLRLQGMDRKHFIQAVPDKVLGAQIGNAMSQNVLERLLIRLLPAAGLVATDRKFCDRWENYASKDANRSVAVVRHTSGPKKRASSSAGPAAKRARKA
eukprot:CAMPEP_0115067410 /NCGR_PEP_ID=MMETSP0227-20121206/11373_1 /TAXON_ID=89957 /ORGANISM="Polarella glacialis, Strain CCMP 1383" /LENGTH=380 /DNA_ID=CAMNT_0002453471 /DNA_START=59 /DNA_END=1201 /DNA_ORIENTATION=-